MTKKKDYTGEKYYFRSEWEYVYALFLEKCANDKKITKWEYEPKTFVFKNGLTYLPDFRITKTDGVVEYHEIKGWFDERSKKKISLMKKEYKNVILKVIDEKKYNKIKKFLTLPKK